MRKKIKGLKFSRNTKSRRALLRSLSRELIIHGSIETSLAKAKVVSIKVNKLITLAKKADLSARRKVLANMANDREVVNKLFDEFSKSKRKSGFVRITEILPRKGDMARMARVELIKDSVSSEVVEDKKKD